MIEENFENRQLSQLLNHPVLSSEQERELLVEAQAIKLLSDLHDKKSDKVSAILIDYLTKNELIYFEDNRWKVSERGLTRINDQAARNKLILHNQRLIVKIAARYTGYGLSLVELMQEGSLGLMRAIDKFEIERGHALSTYASYWIRQAVSRAVEDQTRTIRLPNHRQLMWRQTLRARRKLINDLGRNPTNKEIAAALGLEPHVIADLERWHKDPISFDEAVSGEEGSAIFGDFIEDDESDDMELLAEQVDLAEKVEIILEGLKPRERKIIELRYGINGHGGKIHTLQEVADRFGITRERVRQIEVIALKRLRHPKNTRKLRGYL